MRICVQVPDHKMIPNLVELFQSDVPFFIILLDLLDKNMF